MDGFEKYASSLIEKDFEFIRREAQPYLQLVKEYYDTLQAVQDEIDRCKQFGEKLTVEEVKKILYGPNNSSSTEQASKKDSCKEKVQPSEDLTPPVTSGRPRRNAFRKATESIYHQTNENNDHKTRLEKNVFIKPEKLSMGEPTEILSTEIDARVKQENEEKSGPKRRPPRKTKQKALQKQEKIDEFEETSNSTRRNDSEVILQEVVIPVIDISGEEIDRVDTKTAKSSPKSPRVTRTKTQTKNNEAGKRTRVESSTDTPENSEKRSKSSFEPKKEDANNATFDITNDNNSEVLKTSNTVPAGLNVTFTLDNKKSPSPSNLMTAQESANNILEKQGAVKKILPHNRGLKPSKQVFSPFEGAAADRPPCQTRTRAQTKEQDATPNPPVEKQPTSTSKERPKWFTPLASKFLPETCSTFKVNKSYASQAQNSSMTIKPISGVKAPKTDEREKVRKETLRKRELEAQMEEKKRKREEKQLKARQQRELLEMEKLKLIEQQQLKEEKHKERKQKQREELEREKLQGKRSFIEEKKRKEEKRLEEQRKLDEINGKVIQQNSQIAKTLLQSQKLPVYKTTKTPRLPTTDCYDSDEEEYPDSASARIHHKWTTGDDLKTMQVCIQNAGEKIKNTFFSRQATTPDLEEIFEVIDPRLLKRNSSAIWDKAPKYSLMRTLDSHIESSDENE